MSPPQNTKYGSNENINISAKSTTINNSPSSFVTEADLDSDEIGRASLSKSS